jgi:hypothetical protein
MILSGSGLPFVTYLLNLSMSSEFAPDTANPCSYSKQFSSDTFIELYYSDALTIANHMHQINTFIEAMHSKPSAEFGTMLLLLLARTEAVCM